ncbi:ribosomal maturation YjgA family protein [Asaia prunellae]|uniref:ribosomal maturation YjgA family protein n=1 Tax=Asaia prunellae TaxID=610245 RepID=UPI0004718024|nr:DUF2809 domain-containing protein [Asaia prunellae]
MTRNHILPGKRSRRLLVILAFIILAGLACRLAPLGLTPWIRKWGGSFLWGCLFDCMAALLTHPSHRLRRLAIAFIGASASEALKLLHPTVLETIRQTQTGRFLLGSHFDWRDIAVYALGILVIDIFISRTEKSRSTRR